MRCEPEESPAEGRSETGEWSERTSLGFIFEFMCARAASQVDSAFPACLSLHVWFRLGSHITCALIGLKFELKGLIFTTPDDESYSRHFAADQTGAR